MLQAQGYLQNPSHYTTITIMLHYASTLVTPWHDARRMQVHSTLKNG